MPRAHARATSHDGPCDGRLYLIEYLGFLENVEEEDDEPDDDKKAAGKRIFVLTPQGETLQVFDLPKGLGMVGDFAVVYRKLIVQCDTWIEVPG